MPERRLAKNCTQTTNPLNKVNDTRMKLTVFIGAALSVFVLTGCHPNTSSETLATKHSSNEKIFHKLDPDQPQVEQRITVLIQAPEDIDFALGKVEGVNMSMGYLPVPIERVSAQQWRATFTLGACTEPRMIWRVTLPWQRAATAESGRYTFEFVTETY